MQREREGRDDFVDSGNQFGSFDSFGSRRSMISNLFGGRGLFDDPFFTRPFGSMFESSMSGPSDSFGGMLRTDALKGPVIQELHSDDESEGVEGNTEDENFNPRKHSGSSKQPSVEHPDEDVDGRSKHVSFRSDHNRVEGTQPQAQSYSFRKVTYGGVNGAYYTSTMSRRTGSDGVVLEESKAADKTTGQAAHRISKGIHDKGHSVTRKLSPGGKVDMMQTLHNMNEDELDGFEAVWKGNADRQLPGWNQGFNLNENAGVGSSGHDRQSSRGGLALPSTESLGNAGAGGMRSDTTCRTSSSGGRAKRVVTINIE